MNNIVNTLIFVSVIFLLLTGKDTYTAKIIARDCKEQGQYTLMQTTVKCEVIEND